jgi:hypothetical protein
MLLPTDFPQNPQLIQVFSPYSELGATASDNVDGDVSDGIVIDPSSVDTTILGSYQVTYDVTDSSGNDAATVVRTVNVVDTIDPILSVQDFTVTTDVDSLAFDPADYPDYISVSDNVEDATVMCTPTTLSLGANTVTCTATDTSNNTDVESFTVTLQWDKIIEVERIRGNVRAGSTVPLEWSYFDRETGELLDSSAFNPTVTWVGPAAACGIGGAGDGEDSGSSDFRHVNGRWLYSWQTEDLPGRYRVTITPPGASDPDAQFCVNLK